MIPIWKYTGRLGNQMFEFAALYAYTRDLGVDYYCQSESWFKKYEKDIRQMFTPGIEPYIDKVAIHVRRTDFLTNQINVNLCETDYYQQAMAKLAGQNFLVFSDDIHWCMAQDIFKDCEFSSGKDELEDFNKMAACKSQIIANSTFSWWAAWLNPNPNKVVIAPSVTNWYKDGIDRTRCPEGWIRI